jgi:hypothetical protein
MVSDAYHAQRKQTTIQPVKKGLEKTSSHSQKIGCQEEEGGGCAYRNQIRTREWARR